MAIINEPRALSTALATPAAAQFRPRGGGMAMHAADRHVDRWAPEGAAATSRPGSMRSLGFVDRLVSPWLQTAQRSASLRMFDQYREGRTSERQTNAVSWVFPRPWYQDELDWMAAARRAPRGGDDALLTTRGTYVAPQQAQRPAMPAALYEFVAPSLSVAQPAANAPAIEGVGYGAEGAYSPLISLAAVQAAQLMSRTVAPTLAASARMGAAGSGPMSAGPMGSSSAAMAGRMSPMLQSVLSSMLARTTAEAPVSRLAGSAPFLETPPAPRDDAPAGEQADAPSMRAIALAAQFAEQRAQIAEVQRVARHSAAREAMQPAQAGQAAQAAQASAVQQASAPELREAAQRAETELRARIAARGEQQAAQSEAQHAARSAQQRQLAEVEQQAAGAERARIEERISQRVAERQQLQRLHEQSRSDAAVHARGGLPSEAAIASAPVSAPAPAPRVPAEVFAAIAALPPELAAYLGQRPDRAMDTINELNEAFRAVELMARREATGAAFEPTRGPRMMMPAGLGGLVSAVDHAQGMAQPSRAMAMAMQPSSPQLSPAGYASFAGSSAAQQAPRAPGPRAFTGPRELVAPTSALGATMSAQPAALGHVAWADRWLARFAGASPQSLDAFGAAAGPSRMQALAAAAPGSVFVAPMFDIEQDPRAAAMTPARQAQLAAAYADPSPAHTMPTFVPTYTGPSGDVVRFSDDAETPDDVFAAIAESAARDRASHMPAPVASMPTFDSAPSQLAHALERETYADQLAHSSPSAPGAGFAAQLASSPFAPALRHVLPLGSAPTFDVRALFGDGIAATYLSGVLEPMTSAFDVGGGLPSWAQWAEAGAGDERAAATPYSVPSFDPTYVAPSLGDFGEAADGSGLGGGLGGLGLTAATEAALPAALIAQLAASSAPLTTLRSTLLAWEGDAADTSALFSSAPSATTTTSSVGAARSPGRSMLDAMSLPLLGGDAATHDHGTWAAPGMIADRAQQWSVEQERSTTDLALDFVTPELVMAARVYGLGPVEAAQAVRLALAGPGGLAAMAGAVDRTFVQAMAIEAERRESSGGASGSGGVRRPATAYPLATPSSGGADFGAAADSGGVGDVAGIAQLLASSGASFGVERRQPRGAFLWPSASMSALGLHAAGPDGDQSMSVAALELLAAQAVAEIGTFTAFGGYDDDAGESAPGAAQRGSFSGGYVGGAAAGAAPGAAHEPSESDVLGQANSVVAPARRARFEALYLALSQSSDGRAWSPAARAARALALAGRSEDGPVSAYERATTAWDVLPVVYANESATEMSVGANGAMTAGGGRGRSSFVRTARTASGALVQLADSAYDDSTDRASLGSAARAGEALTTYITAAPSAPAPTSSAREMGSSGPASRAPTAAQEMVRTGRPSGQFGGGEVEIPTWFESAARKMLEDRGGASDGISLAELTLISAAPPSHVAASTRAVPSAAPHSPGSASTSGGKDGGGSDKPPFDVEKVAQDIYRHILSMMETERRRNGERFA